MNKIGLLLWSLLITITAFTQNYQYEFNGTLKIDGEISSPPYRILFNIDGPNIDGVAYFNVGGADETHSKISGEYDGVNISFIEAKILYPIHANYNYCLIHLKGKVSLQPDNTSFIGDFVGYLNGDKNRICGKGYMMMSADEKVEPQLEKKEENIKAVSDEKNEVTIPATPPKEEQIIVTEDNNPTLNFEEDLKVVVENKPTSISTITPTIHYADFEFHTSDRDLEMLIVDHKPDGDRVTILIDGTEIVSNFEVTKNPKIVPLSVDKVTHIKIISTAHGKNPPNTAEITLKDSKNTQHLQLNLDINKSSEINIFRK